MMISKPIRILNTRQNIAYFAKMLRISASLVSYQSAPKSYHKRWQTFKMTEKKPIYTTFSWIRFSKYLIFEIIIIFIALWIFLDFGFDDEININAIAFGVFLLIILTKNDSKEFAVYDNILRIKSYYLVGLISHKTDFKLSDIKDIEYSGKFSQTTDLTEDLLSFLPILGSWNTLTIKTVDNKTHEYKVRIYKEKLEIVIETIKKNVCQHRV